MSTSAQQQGSRWGAWVERARSDVSSPGATDPHFGRTLLVPAPRGGWETQVRLDVYNVSPHDGAAFDEIAIEREPLAAHELLAAATFNLGDLLKQLRPSRGDGGKADHESGVVLVPRHEHQPAIIRMPLDVRRFFNKNGNRWQRVGGIAEVKIYPPVPPAPMMPI